MGSLIISISTGAIIGWIGSLVMQTDTSAGILGDIGLGALTGGIVAFALTSGYLLDSFIAAAFAAILMLGVLALARRAAERR